MSKIILRYYEIPFFKYDLHTRTEDQIVIVNKKKKKKKKK